MCGATIPPRLLEELELRADDPDAVTIWASPTRPCSAPSCSPTARRESTSTRSTGRPRRARSSRRSSCCALGSPGSAPPLRPGPPVNKRRPMLAPAWSACGAEREYRRVRALHRSPANRSASAWRWLGPPPYPVNRWTRSLHVRRSDRARRVRVTVDRRRGIEVVLPRGRAAGDAEAALDKLRPGSSGGEGSWRTRRRPWPPGGTRSPISARRCAGRRSPGAIARASPRRQRCSCREARRPAPRSSAGTAAPRAPRSRPRLDRARALAGSAIHERSRSAPAHALGELLGSGAMSFNWRLLLGARAASSTTSSGTRSATSR